MIIKFIIIIYFLYICYHLVVYFNNVNKSECTTIYKVNKREQQRIKDKDNVYNEGVLEEFYNIIRNTYIKTVNSCITNDDPECNVLSISDWENIKDYLINNSDIKDGFEKEIIKAYMYRFDKCLNDPDVECSEDEKEHIKEKLPLEYTLEASRYRYANCLKGRAFNQDPTCSNTEILDLKDYIR